MTINSILDFKKENQPITMVTAYDYPTAQWAENSDVDCLLVGDSLGMVALGYEDTTLVTMDDMIHHCKAVSRGCTSRFIIGDMPFGSFQVSTEAAVRNAIRFVSEGRANAIKLEGGKALANTIKAIVTAGIPVMGHIGLQPQSLNAMGGFKVQGKSIDSAKQLIEDALALQEAGCFSIVLETIPEPLAKLVTQELNIPTIGIGSGKYCSGQILVISDILGMTTGKLPKFVKAFSNSGSTMIQSLNDFHSAVKNREFPDDDNTYQIKDSELKTLQNWLKH